MAKRIIRITELENLVKRINEASGHALEPINNSKPSGTRWNIGTYTLGWAYGGVRLEQIASQGGGIRVISTVGYGTKRELYNWMQAFLNGMQEVNKAAA